MERFYRCSGLKRMVAEGDGGFGGEAIGAGDDASSGGAIDDGDDNRDAAGGDRGTGGSHAELTIS